MNISLPEALKTFVDEQVADGGYSTSSEYVRELIRREWEKERFRKLILEGAASPIAGEADDPGHRTTASSRLAAAGKAV